MENDENSRKQSIPHENLKKAEYINPVVNDIVKSEGVSDHFKSQTSNDCEKPIPGYFSRSSPVQDNPAQKINQVSADLDVKNILSGPRNRTRKMNTSAAVYMELNAEIELLTGQPFFSCLASSITTDRFNDKMNRFDNEIVEEENNSQDPKS